MCGVKRDPLRWGSLKSIACTALGAACGAGLYLHYNRALVGERLIPPVYLTTAANRYGFGPDIGLSWAQL